MGAVANEERPPEPAMTTPDFFESAPQIRVTDPLAGFLGGARAGVLEYSYLDVVKLAGHSCPTVATTYLMGRKALAHLYPNELPRRGEIRVELRDPADQGVTGVIAAVLGMITGAAGVGGFKGLAGRFGRKNLLTFGAPITGEVRFTRLDTGTSVEASAHPELAPSYRSMHPSLGMALQPDVSDEQLEAFGLQWQARVRELLVDLADDPRIVTLSS